MPPVQLASIAPRAQHASWLQDPFRIAIADDHDLMRDALRKAIELQPDLEFVGEGVDARDAIDIAVRLLPDVLALDVNMPGNGLKAAVVICCSSPSVRIVMLTAYDDEQTVSSALRAGALAYVLKGSSESEFIEIVRSVARGESYISPGLAADLRQGNRGSSGNGMRALRLLPREREIIDGLARGRGVKEAGDRLGLEEARVKRYLTNILTKLHVKCRFEAVLAGYGSRPLSP